MTHLGLHEELHCFTGHESLLSGMARGVSFRVTRANISSDITLHIKTPHVYNSCVVLLY